MRGSIKNAQVSRVNRSPSDFRYFDIGRHWNKTLKPIFESAAIQEQLVLDFSKYVYSKKRSFEATYPDRHHLWNYDPSKKPKDWDSVAWRCDRRGRPFSFDDYLCAGACHWIANSLLLTARIAFPDRPWIIVSGIDHTTVWDQFLTFFDMNYFAFGASPEKCAINTVLHPESIFLRVGELKRLAWR